MSLGGALKGAGSGATTGASIGSFVPGIGTLIGGGLGAGIGGLLGLFGGGDDEKKKAKFDPNQQAIDTIGRLNQQADTANAKGAEFDAMSTASLAPVIKYFQAIASGDPQALLAATMPERGRVIDQYDAARKSASTALPRSGGATSALLNSYVSEANALSDTTANARKEGINSLSKLGVTTAGLSLSADQLASADLDSIIRAVFGQQQIDSQNRGQNMAMWGDIGTAAGSIIGAVLTGGKK
jgi:phage tail tape-measure protein